MPFNFRLNVLNVFRQLGIQTGAQLPQLEENVQMVMQLTDLSRLVPAPIEPRGLAGINIEPLAGSKSVIQLQSLSPGGIFIESLFFRADVAFEFENFIVNVGTNDLGLAVSNQNINIGGSPISTIFSGQRLSIGNVGARLPAQTGSQQLGFSVGMFIPNQFFLTVSTSANDTRLDIAILYRELPAVEEVG